MNAETDDLRFVVISTWGQHFVLAPDEDTAMEMVENEGYHVNDGTTEEWEPEYHGSWEGS